MGLIILFVVGLLAVGVYAFFSKRKNRQEKHLVEIGKNLFDPGSWKVTSGSLGTGLPSCFLEGTIRGRGVRYMESTEKAALVIECGDVVNLDRASEIQEQVRRQLAADSAKFYAAAVFRKTVLLVDALRPFRKGFEVWKSKNSATWNVAMIQDCFNAMIASTPQPEDQP